MLITELHDEVVNDCAFIRLDGVLNDNDISVLLGTLWELAWDATMEGQTLQNCYPTEMTALVNELTDRGPVTDPEGVELLEKIIGHATGPLGDTWGSKPKRPGIDRLIALRPADDPPLVEQEEDLVLDEHMDVHVPGQMPYPSGL